MIAEEFAGYLAQKGHGTLDVDISIDFQPDQPDNLLSLYNESAPVPAESQSLAVDQYGLQILIRNEANATAQSKLEEIHRDLVGFSGILNGYEVTDLNVVTPPSRIGRDEHNRAEWTAHYRYRLISEGNQFRS